MAARWDAARKQTELDFAALEQFYKVYGEFFAVWKLWDDECREGTLNHSPALERITGAEAQLEALLVRISSQRMLSAEQLDTVGAFRHGYQTLRAAIRAREPLSSEYRWESSGSPQYAAFKGLAAKVAVILRPEVRIRFRNRQAPTALEAATSLRVVTSNLYEPWRRGDEILPVWEAVARKSGVAVYCGAASPDWGNGNSPHYHEKAIERSRRQ